MLLFWAMIFYFLSWCCIFVGAYTLSPHGNYMALAFLITAGCIAWHIADYLKSLWEARNGIRYV